jgi:hypothetical protein
MEEFGQCFRIFQGVDWGEYSVAGDALAKKSIGNEIGYRFR